MLHFSFCEFIEYYNKRYFTNSEHISVANHSNLVSCVLANRDPWFYIFDCELYILHLLGIEIEYVNKEYVIYRNDNCIIDLYVGDRVQKINGHSVENISHYIQDTIILDCIDVRTETSKTVKIPTPNFLSEPKGTNEYVALDDSIGYLRINSFSLTHLLHTAQFLHHEHLYIDLRKCSGGPVNEMIRWLSLFSPRNDQMHLRVTCGDGSHAISRVPYCNHNNKIKRISLLVDKTTASSAEIFCIVLSHYYPCDVYGNKTTGKLVIQNIVQVSDCTVAIPIYKLEKNPNIEIQTTLNFDGDAIIPDHPILMLPECLQKIVSNSTGIIR